MYFLIQCTVVGLLLLINNCCYNYYNFNDDVHYGENVVQYTSILYVFVA